MRQLLNGYIKIAIKIPNYLFDTIIGTNSAYRTTRVAFLLQGNQI